MRNLAMLAAAALVLGTTGGVPAWADHAHDDLVVLATVTDFDKQDQGEEGPSEGDRFRYEADLTDEAGDDAGDSRGGCVLTDRNDHQGWHGHMSTMGHGDDQDADLVARCFAGFALDDGKLFIGGTAEREDFEDHSVTFPIKGGKGDYEDAQGEATVEILGHDEGHHKGKDHGHHHASYRPAGHGDHGEHRDHHDGPHFKVTFDFE